MRRSPSAGWTRAFVSLRDCRFELAGSGPGIAVPGFDDSLPDAAFVRGVPGGSLEQVVLRLDLLHALKAIGMPVYNDGRAIERTVDKAMTSFVLARAGIPTPATWVTESESEARAVALREAARGSRAGGEAAVRLARGGAQARRRRSRAAAGAGI